MKKMKANLEAFYNNQFQRDAELLNILRKREAEMEGNMMKKIEAFKYLYKEQFKGFESAGWGAGAGVRGTEMGSQAEARKGAGHDAQGHGVRGAGVRGDAGGAG